MKTTVIYHSADFDGLFCREIARKFLGDKDVNYIGWNFGDAPVLLPSEGPIYVIDLPIDRPFGFAWNKRNDGETVIRFQSDTDQHFLMQPNPLAFLQRVIWIDHHKSSIETHPKDIPGYRIDGVAACRLAWQWFYRGYAGGKGIENAVVNTISGRLPTKQDFVDRIVYEPLAVRLAGEYDVWDKRDPRAELFQLGLRSQDLTECWPLLLSRLTKDQDLVDGLLEKGRVLQFARANEYRDVITSQGFDVKWEGLVFLACNSHEADIRSHLFEAGIKPHHEALLGFTYNGQNKKWQVSMYYVPHRTDLDLSAIAARHGGGGHRGACGFTCGTLPIL